MKYVTRASIRADWDTDPPRHLSASRTIIESDTGPMRTGLLDASGNELYRIKEKAPMGFDLTRKE